MTPPIARGGEHADARAVSVNQLALSCGLGTVRLLVGIFPDATAQEIAEETFRFAHVDVDVYQSARDVVEYLWPRMVSGGIIVFDDFGTHGCEGVTRFVNEFSARRDCLLVHNLNGHAVITKIEAWNGTRS